MNFMDLLKGFISKEGWKIYWKFYITFLAYGAGAYVLGAFSGAMIQYLKDIIK